jgi:peptidoglycan DL-endopeptidase LytF
VVQRGDTLYRIAKTFDTKVRAIQIANGLRGSRIFVGQTLVIPTSNPVPQPTAIPTPRHSSGDKPKDGSTNGQHESHSSKSSGGSQPKTYTVKAGDNLFRIGLRFGVSVGALQTANGLRTIYIRVGQVLAIP